jgi:hypothetical protein
MVIASIVLGIPSVLMTFSPAFFIGIPFLAAGVYQWMVWAANPQYREPRHGQPS